MGELGTACGNIFHKLFPAHCYSLYNDGPQSLPTTPHHLGSRRLSTTLCWRRLGSIIIQGITMSWEQLVENISVCAHCPSLTLVILTLSEQCQELRVVRVLPRLSGPLKLACVHQAIM